MTATSVKIKTPMLTKKELRLAIKLHKESIFIEKWTVSPDYFLYIKTPAEGSGKRKLLGKVGKIIHKWFALIETDSKHPNEKCTWYKFK